MANVSVFDPATNNSKSISVTVTASIIEEDEDGQMDYFVVLSTSAKKKTGSAISDHTIRELSDLSRGSTQQDGSTTSDYSDLTDSIEDHILNMVEGTGGTDAMDFS